MNELKDPILLGYKNFIITNFVKNTQYLIDNVYTYDELVKDGIPLYSINQIKNKSIYYDRVKQFKDYNISYIGINDFTHYESVVFLLHVVNELVNKTNISKFINSYRINFSKVSDYTDISYTNVSHINSLEIRSKITGKILAHIIIEIHNKVARITFKLIDRLGNSRLSTKLEVPV